MLVAVALWTREAPSAPPLTGRRCAGAQNPSLRVYFAIQCPHAPDALHQPTQRKRPAPFREPGAFSL